MNDINKLSVLKEKIFSPFNVLFSGFSNILSLSINRKMKNSAEIDPRNTIIEDYLASHETKKLQLGAGPTSLDGWLSTDIAPESDNIVFLDATKPFPFDNSTFDYVFSEHMIEHITMHDGLLMLQECRRILKPGGAIRVATPDMKTLFDLYYSNGNPLTERYIRWITDRFLDGVSVYKASIVINNAFRNWGHQFLYDEELLTMALLEVGFTDIQRCHPGESGDANLQGIESHGKNVDDDEMAAFETMVLEGKCPI